MKEFKVVFGMPSGVIGDDPRIAIYPRNRGWNDFGFNFLAAMQIDACDGRQSLKIDLYVIPLDENGDPVRFPLWYDRKSNEVKGVFRHKRSGFLTLLGSDDAYRMLRRWCKSVEEYRGILFDLNEITWALKSGAGDTKTIERILALKEFKLGVIRAGGAYRALRSGFDGGERPFNSGADSRVPYTISLPIPGFSANHALKIRYRDSQLIEDRVHCIVGRNGVGKSRFLRALILELARVGGSTSDSFADVSFDESNATVGSTSDLPRFSRVLSYSTEVDSILPSRVKSNAAFDYQFCSLVAKGRSQEMRLSSLLLDLFRGRDEVVTFDRLGALRAAVSPHMPWRTVCIPLRKSLDGTPSFRDDEGGVWIRFDDLEGLNEERVLLVSAEFDAQRDLGFFGERGESVVFSSGQRTFLKFALHFLSFASKGSLIIVDEPETHLHPNLVSTFAILLYRVLRQTKSVALVATHSPYVVRELPSHCVHVFRDDSAGVVVDSVYLRTLGASPTSVSMAIFGDDSASKHYEKLVRILAKSGLSIEEMLEAHGDVLSPDMLMQIRAKMKSAGGIQ